MIANRFGELVALLEAVQTNDALAAGQIALRQMLTDYFDQIEHDWRSDRFGQFLLNTATDGVDAGVVQSPGIPQLELGLDIRITGGGKHLECYANVLAVQILANRWQHGCLDHLRMTTEKQADTWVHKLYKISFKKSTYVSALRVILTSSIRIASSDSTSSRSLRKKIEL